MATKLDKSITRESTVLFDGREVIVTLTEDQKIAFKLKGMKSGHVEISISDLYTQLKGGSDEPVKRKRSGNDSISLQDLRSSNMIANLDYQTKVKFDNLINDLIELNS